ncbi:hypothetical protein [Acidithiobacillus ferrooxidans]|uniref:hypothetical protein n=1 Tax=Acidithiobacillus ferrooxidans TaxID=920 RepID=UPI0013D7F7F8|nr:hypothetical protein [Acidithiobacillus ferrooxidans]
MADWLKGPVRGFAHGLLRLGKRAACATLLGFPACSYAHSAITASHRLAIHQEAVVAHGVLRYGERRLLHQGEECATLGVKMRGACYARMSRDAQSLAAGTPPTPACPVLAAQVTDYFQASASLMNTCSQGHPCFSGAPPARVEVLRGAVRRLLANGMNGVCD